MQFSICLNALTLEVFWAKLSDLDKEHHSFSDQLLYCVDELLLSCESLLFMCEHL